jgi:hypothetical protein
MGGQLTPKGSGETEHYSGTSALTQDELRVISDFRSAMEAVENATGVPVEDASDYGTGFDVLSTDAKGTLCGVPFVIVEWRFNEGDAGEFVSVSLVTEDGRKLVLNDGSTGIYQQLKEITGERLARGITAQTGLAVRKGLRVNEYEYSPTLGRAVKRGESAPDKAKAKTYYLAL